jgi:excisionase family DNA binding protein
LQLEGFEMPQFYRVPDAAREFGLSRSALYVLLAEGKILARKVGKRTLIEGASVRDFLGNQPFASFRPPPGSNAGAAQ